MPDLQSELKKLETLAFDDEGETTETAMTLPHAFKPTNNVSRETFNYIKNNPGTTRQGAIKALENLGYKPSSTGSLIGQFVRQGIARKVNGGVFTNQQDYTPIKPKLIRSKVAKVTDNKVKQDIIESVQAQKRLPKLQVEVTPDTTVQSMLSRMSILQAREMYDELKKVFSA